jgi:hypothetical protein
MFLLHIVPKVICIMYPCILVFTIVLCPKFALYSSVAHRSLVISGFDPHRSYDRSYAIKNKECCCPLQLIYLVLTHIAVIIVVTQLGTESVVAVLMHIAVTVVVTQLGIESVCCLLQSVCLTLTHIAIAIK